MSAGANAVRGPINDNFRLVERERQPGRRLDDHRRIGYFVRSDGGRREGETKGANANGDAIDGDCHGRCTGANPVGRPVDNGSGTGDLSHKTGSDGDVRGVHRH